MFVVRRCFLTLSIFNFKVSVSFFLSACLFFNSLPLALALALFVRVYVNVRTRKRKKVKERNSSTVWGSRRVKTENSRERRERREFFFFPRRLASFLNPDFFSRVFSLFSPLGSRKKKSSPLPILITKQKHLFLRDERTHS